MKSVLYWQVMPKPKSLQNPVSFLITCRQKNFKSQGAQQQEYIRRTHRATTSAGRCFCVFERQAPGAGNISKPLSNVAQH